MSSAHGYADGYRRRHVGFSQMVVGVALVVGVA
jgi:hypothetical protein